MAMIPDRERGYSVEADTLIVHERYQDHAPRAMRTSALGVTNVALQRDMEPVPCEVCFPPPPVARSRRKVGPITPDDLYFAHERDSRRDKGGDVRPAEPIEVHAGETFVASSEPTETVTVTSTEPEDA